jgi:hypothetical protein
MISFATLGGLLFAAQAALAAPLAGRAGTYTNVCAHFGKAIEVVVADRQPLRQNGADPFVGEHLDIGNGTRLITSLRSSLLVCGPGKYTDGLTELCSKFWFVSTSYTDIRVTSSPTLE